jgi:dihydrofolate synthase/folylpolyglutamate synthase
MKFTEAIHFLQSFPDSERGSFGATRPSMSLGTMKTLLQRLGNPQNALRTIHITGSKGKGSTATFITSILKAAGYRTALYTSPHLHSYRERIAFDLRPVSEAEFSEGIATIHGLIKQEEARGEGPYSTFGVITALFFHLVKNRISQLDWQIVEVGLGGTHDATNVFDSKDITVVTAISLEHTSILGKSIKEIVKNKAGIITPGCTCVVAPQRDQTVKATLEEICTEREAKLIDVSATYSFEQLQQSRAGQKFTLHSSGIKDTYSMRLLGQHQIENAMTAVTVVRALEEYGTACDGLAIRAGLFEANLPGRFEILTPDSLGRRSAQANQQYVILDGAHNQDSAMALSQTIQSVFPGRKCILILGVNVDKHLEAMWPSLRTVTKMLIATRTDNPRAMAPGDIISRLTALDPGLISVISPNICEALARAFNLKADDDLICITGSLYLVAEAREQLLRNRVAAPLESSKINTIIHS